MDNTATALQASTVAFVYIVTIGGYSHWYKTLSEKICHPFTLSDNNSVSALTSLSGCSTKKQKINIIKCSEKGRPRAGLNLEFAFSTTLMEASLHFLKGTSASF